MYEDKTYSAILEEALSAISSDVLKTEGSLVYNAVSALAYELNRLYIQLDYLIDEMDPATADYDGLVLLCAQRGIYPDDATYCHVRIQADAELPAGTRFSLSAYNYYIDSALDDDDGGYLGICEEAGSGPNGLLGELTAIDYVEGLTYAEITEILVAGEDADGAEELLEKYLASFETQGFGGNIAAYQEYLNAIDGIGGTKVYPVWNGYGTVKCVLISSDYGAVSDYLISEIEDLVAGDGGGYGFAPINHIVTIESVEEVEVSIATTIEFESGYDYDTCSDAIASAISDYLLSLSETWADGDSSDYITVYISRLESAILGVTGIVDISGTELNGTAANLVLDSDQIPVIGEVSVS